LRLEEGIKELRTHTVVMTTRRAVSTQNIDTEYRDYRGRLKLAQVGSIEPRWWRADSCAK